MIGESCCGSVSGDMMLGGGFSFRCEIGAWGRGLDGRLLMLLTVEKT